MKPRSELFKNQNYASLKAKCQRKGVLFEDPEFPAANKSLFYSHIEQGIEWKRPSDMCKVPRLVKTKVDEDNLNSGKQQPQWFFTACANLVNDTRLWNKVVPNYPQQEYSPGHFHGGILVFNIWRLGHWQEVVIDDRLPTRNGKLIFTKSRNKSEFWQALLEKAYAKLFLDYESLQHGTTLNTLVDLTGGVSERIVGLSTNFQDLGFRRRLFSALLEAAEKYDFINCVVQAASEDAKGTPIENGLVPGDGYIITKVKYVALGVEYVDKFEENELYLVRLFTPWSESKWKGKWSQECAEWEKMPKSVWNSVGVNYTEENEFWMSFDDFLSHFTELGICHIYKTDSRLSYKAEGSVYESVFSGQWSPTGYRGGNEFGTKSFLFNPQFQFDVISDVNSHVTVSLLQDDVLQDRSSIGPLNKYIGFYVMKADLNRKYRCHVHGKLEYESKFVNDREVFGSFFLSKGRYVLIPCCTDKEAEGRFMVRIYTDRPSRSSELMKECPESKMGCFDYKMVATIHILKATGLELPAPKINSSIWSKSSLKSLRDSSASNPPTRWSFLGHRSSVGVSGLKSDSEKELQGKEFQADITANNADDTKHLNKSRNSVGAGEGNILQRLSSRKSILFQSKRSGHNPNPFPEKPLKISVPDYMRGSDYGLGRVPSTNISDPNLLHIYSLKNHGSTTSESNLTRINETVGDDEAPLAYSQDLFPYLVIKCEGETIITPFKRHTSSPEFNISATFYKKSIEKPIQVKVYNRSKKRFGGDYICESRIYVKANEDGEGKKTYFTGKKNEADVMKPGSLYYVVQTDKNLKAL